MRERAVYAHSIWLDETDRQLMHDTRSAAAISPTSNQFLASGYFDYIKADEADMLYGLASDVGGGMSFSPFRTMQAAYVIGRESHAKQGLSLSPQRLWWQHTAELRGHWVCRVWSAICSRAARPTSSSSTLAARRCWSARPARRATWTSCCLP